MSRLKALSAIALPIFCWIFGAGNAEGQSMPQNMTVLITIEPRLTLSADGKEVEKQLKSAAEPDDNKYTRQSENNLVLYTVTE